MRRFLLILCLVILPMLALAREVPLTGRVVVRNTKKPIPDAVVEMPERGLWAVADKDGRFTFGAVPEGEVTLGVSCIGYVPSVRRITVRAGMAAVLFELNEETLKVERVVVTAKDRTDAMSTSRSIGSQALAHLQMIDASDISSLLPGGKTVNPNLMNENPFSLRDGGSNAGNASFGTAVEVDGVRLSNNATMGAVTGVGTRNIASTNIASVEVVTGVPSAEYGDISSGMVRLHTRKGRTPFMVTFTTNPRTKQFSVSKGFDLQENRGVLNTSVEYTRATQDPVSPYTSYSRTGISVNYRKTFRSRLRFDFGVTGNIGGMDSEDDPDAENGEWRRARDNAFRANTALKWQLDKTWITNLDFRASINYADKFDRECLHPTPGATAQAVHAVDKGYYVADILPANYFTFRNVDSKQLDYAADIKAQWVRTWGRVRSSAKTGLAWRADGNVGRGAYYDDDKLAPNGYRPYPYTDIPYMHNLAFYLEELLTLPVGRGQLSLMAGLRIENTWIRNTKYRNTDSYSPRFNLKYKINDHVSLRGGWGLTEKLPTLGVLYPEPLYRDFSAFEKRYGEGGTYIYYTEPYSMRFNPDLRWQRNRNAELGVDLQWGDFSMSLVAFFNRTTRPFSRQSSYDPFSYRKSYVPENMTLPEHPSFKTDPATGDIFVRDAQDASSGWVLLPSDPVRTFARTSVECNGSPIDRKGLEFVLNFPMINPIRTELRLDGSFTYTKYVNTGESQYLMAIYTGNQSYPYVGIYPDNGGAQSTTYNGQMTKRLNMNLTATTHIPAIRLIVSLRLEASLLQRRQNLSEYGGREYAFNIDEKTLQPTGGSIYDGRSYTAIWPVAYLDLDGVRHPFTDAEKNDPRFASMMLRSTNAYQYRLIDYDPYFSANLSITKEIGDHVSVSFYANNFTNSRKFVRPYPGGVGAVFTPEFYYGLTVRVKF